MDHYVIFRTHPDNLTILNQARDVKASTPRSPIPPNAPFNSITKKDHKVLATSSTSAKYTTHVRNSDSDISVNYASLILKHTCRKPLLNVKPA